MHWWESVPSFPTLVECENNWRGGAGWNILTIVYVSLQSQPLLTQLTQLTQAVVNLHKLWSSCGQSLYDCLCLLAFIDRSVKHTHLRTDPLNWCNFFSPRLYTTKSYLKQPLIAISTSLETQFTWTSTVHAIYLQHNAQSFLLHPELCYLL
jgi:hypothetical protein